MNTIECVNYTRFVSKFFEVGKTFSELLFGASLSAKDTLCSSVLEISLLHVTSKILQLFLTPWRLDSFGDFHKKKQFLVALPTP